MNNNRDFLTELAHSEFGCLQITLSAHCNVCREKSMPLHTISQRIHGHWDHWGLLCTGCLASVIAAGGAPIPEDSEADW